MFIRRVALLFGIVFLAFTVLGFLGTGIAMPHMMHGDMESMPRVLGMFPVNVAHNGLHLIFGVWALMAARSTRASMVFAMVSGAVYLALTGIGLYVPEGFGIAPVGGWDVLLHAGIAFVLVACALLEAVRPATAVRT
jgi:hypothetical protein